MAWCYHFDAYLLEYMLSQISHQISPELLVSSRLDALQNYDRKNILSCVTHSRSIWSMNAILFRQPVSFLYIEVP